MFNNTDILDDATQPSSNTALTGLSTKGKGSKKPRQDKNES
ncbi:MAG: hypothetical protein Q8N96_15060 [Methylovulum sp.]|nr:hypothetical protein [Methylovulum sp.]